ncbi:hypothetical protein PWT90_02742 [Aphanocladium album]|nr:hypothetical protein PWT90_02742 [Aphanocladium album]
MKFSLAAAAAALASGAKASIVSIQLPETIASGKPIPAKLVNNIDQSSTYQIGITFGFGTAPSDPGDMIGNPVASIFLQGKQYRISHQQGSANFSVSRRHYAGCAFHSTYYSA